jgi:AAA15 family ATPase/GTPase
MSLIKFSYSEFENDPRYWEISDVTFESINLVVGKNSAGKSRLLTVINSLAQILTGHQTPFASGEFSALIRLKDCNFLYEIGFRDGGVLREALVVDGIDKLLREDNGTGKIWYDKEGKFLDFKLPFNAVAAVNRRDEIQHPYLIELHHWASNVIKYSFGTDFGRTQVLDLSIVDKLFNNSTPSKINDTNDLVGTYSAAFLEYQDDYDRAIIDDMEKLGYSLTDIGSDNLQSFAAFPIAALGIFTVEKELGFKNPQMHMSQGMFRALALVIHLNQCIFSKEQKLILVDDIGEGLDFERSIAIIHLLIDKAKNNNLQLIMTSNDRFVMNEIPLDYWAVLKRKGNVVKMFNLHNSEDQFNKFKYLGLNNFEFFASDFFEPKVSND